MHDKILLHFINEYILLCTDMLLFHRMVEVGESSGVREEEPQDIPLDLVTVGVPVMPDEKIPLGDRDSTPDAELGEFRDIPVDTEQMYGTEAEDAGSGPPGASPVRGGVM